MNNNLKTYIVALLEDSQSREAIHFICQAEDERHASEQTVDMYPQCRVSKIFKSPQPGEKVWWSDPDDDVSSGHYEVLRVETESGDIEYADTIVVIKNHHGSVAEVYASELDEVLSIEELAVEVRNSEANDGCAADYTIVKRSWLIALLDHIQETTPSQKAKALTATQQALSQAMQHSEQLTRFIQHIAGLKMWGYDKDDGNPHDECDEPDEGHIDSHNCLMELIEQARKH